MGPSTPNRLGFQDGGKDRRLNAKVAIVDTDILVEGRLRTLYLVVATMGRENVSDVRSQRELDRLAAALKENLKRRKAQARGRKAATSADDEARARSETQKRDKPSD